MAPELKLIEGALAVDDRGALAFVNGFSLEGVKRFYVVSNHEAGFVRAWHGHKKEAKHVFVSSGEAIVAAVKIDDWDKPSKDLPIHRFVLSSRKPAILFIPAGYANGFRTLTPGAQVMFFSSASLQDSQGDDYRFDARRWDPWGVVER